MATIETDRPFHESFEGGIGALSHNWGGNVDTSTWGEITLSGWGGTMEFPGGVEAGHGFGTYTFDARVSGDHHGPAILLWPGNDTWPGPEIDVVEIHEGRLYGTVHHKDPTGGWDNYESVFFDGVSNGEFHEFQVVWEPERITYKVDGRVMGAVTENVPADHDAGGMNNVIGVMNTSDGTSVTVRSIDYRPLGAAGGGTPAAPPRDEAPAGPGQAPPAEPQASPPPAGTDAGQPASLSAGEGPDALVLEVSQQAYKGNATYTVFVDGAQVGGTFTASALHDLGRHDTLTLRGDWGPGEHEVTVELTNDLWEPGEGDRNLFVTGADYNGSRSDALGDSWYGGSFTVAGDYAF